MGKIKTAIIGCGKVAAAHANSYKKIPNALLTAVCDLAPERAKTFADTYKVKAYTDIAAMIKEEHIQVEIYEGDYDDINEVDRKLIRLAKSIDGIIITNDFNLNKVSEFQNVPVFNINALAQAIKPVVIPGETLKTTVVKQGTERQQGVAYLDDGTMIVVEDGQYYMNEEIEVVVTSALQTAAGRMIFAKPLHSQKKIKQ